MTNPFRSVMQLFIAASVAIAVVVIGLAVWRYVHGVTVNTRVDQGQAGAVTNSAVDAMNTMSGNADNATAIDNTVKEGTDAIRQAPGSNAQVDPRSRDAALRATCRMRSYRDTGRCRELLGSSAEKLGASGAAR